MLAHAHANMLHPACLRIPLNPSAVNEQEGTIVDPQLHQALQDMLQVLARALAAPRPKPQPSWQAVSSMFPVVQRNDATPFKSWRAEIWRPND
ncbi:hypothetical protein [Paractinoplanes durhamensis]|uniref:hypothetical protein n=1 Tax=Paractinoplanes durhamensis TaxID=113563 RepID=UPI003642AE2F